MRYLSIITVLCLMCTYQILLKMRQLYISKQIENNHMVYIISIKPAIHYIKSFKKALKMHQNVLENPHVLIWLKKQSTFLSNIHYVSQTLIFLRFRH